FEAMVPDRMPKSLLVIGSGAIGIEFASFYRTFGVEVTVVEILPQILPAEDAEIAAFARKQFEKQGIKILTGARVTKLDKKADSATATGDDARGPPHPPPGARPPAAAAPTANPEPPVQKTRGETPARGPLVTDAHTPPSAPALPPGGGVAGPP